MDVDYLFSTQTMGMPSFEEMGSEFTPVQMEQMNGVDLDRRYRSFVKSSPGLHVGNMLMQYFGPKQLNYIRPPPRASPGQTLHSTSIDAFGSANLDADSIQNARKALLNNGAQGQMDGKRVIALTKAALVIAARASRQQLETIGVKGAKNDNFVNKVQPVVTVNTDAGDFAKRLNRFIDDKTLRETMWNINLSRSEGLYGMPQMQAIYQDSMQPGMNLQEESVIMQGGSVSANTRRLMNQKAIIGRMMPSGARIANHPMQSIMRVSQQQKALNGFKMKPQGRFA